MPKGSLRLRALLFFGGFGLLLSALLTGGIYLFIHGSGQRHMRETLETETRYYLNQRRLDPQAPLPATAMLSGYQITPAADLPAPLQHLPAGYHHVDLNGTAYLGLVTERPGMKVAFLIDETAQSARERHFLRVLAMLMATLTSLITLVGLWLTRRVVAPIIDLAARIVASESGTTKPQTAYNLDQVSELGLIFERYLERIRSCAERERAFASDVSHELRNPLAVIRGAVEVLEEDAGLDVNQRQRIARIERASQDMAELTSALLRLSREESGQAEDKENCSIATVVRESVDKHRILNGALTVQIGLNIVDAPMLAVEKGLANVVVDNLLGNAMLHARSDRIQVSLERSRLVISDSGKGIDKAELDRIFQRHYRGAESSGSGIGLSLVKRICDLHGWDISIDSSPGRGTSVELFFGKRPVHQP